MKNAVELQRERTWLEVLATAAILAALLVVVVRTATHVIAPRLLTHYDRMPELALVPKRMATATGADADPVNVAVVGSAGEVAAAFRAAGWTAADSLTHASSVAIAKSVLLNRPDSSAPVSSLYLYGRRQDLAFEQEVGKSARSRHHVRLWLAKDVRYDGRPVWIGGATFDLRAGLSRRGLHPTHHIAPDIDQERQALEGALAGAGQVAATFRVTGLGIRVDAHNGDGDRFDTDGELRVVVLSRDGVPHAPPADPGVPPLVALKDRIWSWGHREDTRGP